MPESMVSRVARAIHNAEYEGKLSSNGTAEHALFCQIARADLEAMRDPPQELLNAVAKEIAGYTPQPIGMTAIVLEKFLDAALKEPEKA